MVLILLGNIGKVYYVRSCDSEKMTTLERFYYCFVLFCLTVTDIVCFVNKMYGVVFVITLLTIVLAASGIGNIKENKT